MTQWATGRAARKEQGESQRLEEKTATRATRDRTVDLLKGIGILLVVVGHVQDASGPEAWLLIRRVIFSVHVPLFFVVGGYVSGLAALRRPQSYGQQAASTLLQLGIPFVVFSLVAAAGALFGAGTGPSSLTIHQVGLHFMSPTAGGFAYHLWFIYAFILIRLAYPLFLRVVRWRAALLALALAAASVEWPWQLSLHLAVLHLPLFVLGDILCRSRAWATPRKARLAALPILVALYVLVFVSPAIPLSRFLLGSTGALVLWIAAGELSSIDLRWLDWLGRQTLGIYLWHTMLVPIAAAGVGILLGESSFWVSLVLTFSATTAATAAIVWVVGRTPLSVPLHGRRRPLPSRNRDKSPEATDHVAGEMKGASS